MSNIGSHAHHSIITPECRENRGDDGAFDEAVERARAVYDGIVHGWRSSGPQPTIHLVLGLERPGRAAASGETPTHPELEDWNDTGERFHQR